MDGLPNTEPRLLHTTRARQALRGLGRAAFVVIALLGGARESLAWRVEFITTLDGERLTDSQVCLYKSRGTDGPAALYFASNDVRCLPADQIIDMPSGVWTFYARHASGYVSSHGSALVRRGTRNPDREYQSLRVEMRRAAYVTFRTADENDRFAAYVPMADDSPYAPATFPLPAGEDRIIVPADEPFLIFRVRNGRPIAAGPLTKLKARDVLDAVEILPRPDQHDVIGWIQVDDPSLEDISSLRAPHLTLLGPDGREYAPLYRIRKAGAAHRSLVVFPNAPTGNSVVRSAGPEWRLAEFPITVQDATAGTFLDAPILVRVAQRLTVTWAFPPMITARRQSSCEDDEAPSSESAWTVRVLSCPPDKRDRPSELPRNLEACQTERLAEVKPEAIGAAVFDLRSPGEYVVVLNGSTSRLAASRVTVFPDKDVALELSSRLPAVFGRVLEGERPVRARINFETGSALSDTSGAYEAILEADPLDNVIEVVPCDGSDAFHHIPGEPLRGNRQYNIHIPANRINVAVIDASTGRGVPRAGIGRGLFPTAEEAREARFRGADLSADENGKAVLRRFEPGYFLRICATAEGYALAACADPVSLERDTAREVEIALRPQKARTGRVLVETPLIAGILFRATLAGLIVEEVLVKEDGTFTYVGTREADVLVLTSMNRPLVVLRHPPVEESGELQIAVPSGPIHSFTVEFAESMPLSSGWFTIAVGEAVVPSNALDAHLTRRGLAGFVEDGRPARVVDVLRTAPLRVLAVVATCPPDTRSVSDLFTLPQYAPILEYRDVPPSGRVVFGRP